ncbi:hypothetical protein RJ640_010968 [Escallonia rubra]|uniref:Uncharacterized protein n=1 Tax=Escallonia rubra TaxID=112253 RepID=A0AA88UME4_9ASTE|nr:hypothetical protein RJ640_010968 [Escallonia rubra]
MTTQICTNLSLPSTRSWLSHRNPSKDLQIKLFPVQTQNLESHIGTLAIRCLAKPAEALRTCKNCKTQFDPSLNHPRACRHHTAHYGGETKRKFESVYTGGTMNSPDSGKVFQYWHCCGSEDPFDPGCTAAPHSSYDD